jgi:hypothetical protein
VILSPGSLSGNRVAPQSAAWHRSYARRTGAERGFRHRQGPRQQRHQPRLVPPHGPDTLTLFTTTLLIVRNQRILAAWNTRQEQTQRRAAAGLRLKTRKRRRKTLVGLAAGPS